MNPSYIKSAIDRKSIRQEYINNLKLDTANITRNYNANQIFKSTGTSRPNAIPDTRTTTDKRADKEAIKRELIAEFSTITDGVVANDIVQKLAEEASLLEFAGDQIAYILRKLKERYKYGLPADVAIQQVKKLRVKWEQDQQQTLGLNQQNGQEGGFVANADDLEAIAEPELLENVADFVEDFSHETARIVRQLSNHSLSTTDKERYFGGEEGPMDNDYTQRFSNLIRERPTSEQIYQIMDKIQRYKDVEGPNGIQVQKELQNLRNYCVLTDTSMRLFNNLKMEMDKNYEDTAEDFELNEDDLGQGEEGEDEGGQQAYNQITPPRPFDETAIDDREQPIQATAVAVDTNATNPRTGNVKSAQATAIPTSIEQFMGVRSPKEQGDFTIDQQRAYMQQEKIQIPPNWTKKRIREGELSSTLSIVEGKIAEGNQKADEGHGLGGRGFGRKRRVVMGQGLVRSRANRLENLIDAPMEKPKPYSPFGRYVIHKHKLQDGILQLKTPKGGAVSSLPTESISFPLSKVLRKIVGGSRVDFDELQDLHDDDKGYLHRIIKTAQLHDKISVPRPDYGKEKDELKRFEILKGEIGAGNDNKDLVKEFKVMLMKFVNQGRVPRRHAHEILTDLASQGL